MQNGVRIAIKVRNFEVMVANLDCFDDVITKHIDDRRACTTAVENALENVTDGDYCRFAHRFCTLVHSVSYI